MSYWIWMRSSADIIFCCFGTPPDDFWLSRSKWSTPWDFGEVQKLVIYSGNTDKVGSHYHAFPIVLRCAGNLQESVLSVCWDEIYVKQSGPSSTKECVLKHLLCFHPKDSDPVMWKQVLPRVDNRDNRHCILILRSCSAEELMFRLTLLMSTCQHHRFGEGCGQCHLIRWENLVAVDERICLFPKSANEEIKLNFSIFRICDPCDVVLVPAMTHLHINFMDGSTNRVKDFWFAVFPHQVTSW